MKQISRSVFLLVLFCCIWLQQVGAVETGGADVALNLSPQVEVLADPQKRFTIDDVLSPTVAAGFQHRAPTDGDINLGYTTSAYWFRFSLSSNDQDQADKVHAPWVVEIPNALLNKVWFYAPGQSEVRTGSGLPMASRPLTNRFFAFPVHLTKREQVFHVRVETDHTMLVPLRLWSPKAWDWHLQETMAIQFIYFGGLMALMVIYLLLSLSLRDRRYLLYVLYGLFMGLAMFAGNGYDRLFLWPQWPQFAVISDAVFLGLAGFFSAWLVIEFLGLVQLAPWLARLIFLHGLMTMGIAAVLLCSVWWPMPEQVLRQALVWSALSLGVLTLLACAVALRTGGSPVGLFVSAWVFLWFSAFVAAGHLLGLLQSNAYTAYALQIGTAVELLVLALALSEIVRVERNQRELAQMQRDQYVRFGSMIAHEFRNPLDIVLRQLSLLRTPQRLSEAQRQKLVESMLSAVQRLSRMFDKWLQSDALSHSLEDMNPHPIPLPDWVHEFVENHQYLLHEHALKLNLSPAALRAHADEYHLEIAAANLLENACKYSPAGRTIELATLCKPGFVGISFTDQGYGISPGHQKAIFDEFFRASPGSDIRGMGLGMPIVQRIVKAHGGHLQLDSQVGQGSCITIWLPEHP